MSAVDPRVGQKPCAYAHSREDLPKEQWQPLDAHLQDTATRASGYAEIFCSSDWAFNAGLLHDLGKASDDFQAYLLRENGLDDSEYDAGHGRVNHSSAGAALADQLKLPGRILAYLVAGHHAGLPDWHSADTGMAALSVRLPEGLQNLARIRAYADELLSRMRPLARPPAFLRQPEDYHLWIRMLYSCLVDADFLDTEQFMKGEAAGVRGRFPDITKLSEPFFRALGDLEKRVLSTPVNVIRANIRRSCEQAAEQQPGLFSLTVPTGGGKTLSSMAFALRHAIRYGQRRVIYVIPYTSIIEQTVDTLSGIFGPENVVEHHSNLDPAKETPRTRLASENWDAPIIVTTNVQFFESLYAARSSRCRKLHNVVNSVVILDEAQLLPPELLEPCVDAINQLVKNYRVTMVLATATQPALPGLEKSREIIADPAELYRGLKRTNIRFPESLDEPTAWDAISKQLQTHDQVLCVVNTRRDCYDLFKLMPDGTVHLSALMCGAHRTKVIGEIKSKLKAGQPIRVISTQLVEAGVDIDFPVVYRALSGFASIAQAAGRCNREGGLGGLGEVQVFVPPKPSPRGMLLKGEDTTREFCALPDVDPQRPDSFLRYFNLFYSRVNDMGSQFRDWLVKDASPDLHFQFRTAAENFKMIDDQARRPVIVRYGESDKWLERLRFAGPTREIMRGLQRYMVSLPTRMVGRMLADGRLEEVDAKKASGIVVQCNLKLYDDKVGLDIYKGTLPVEDLVQ